MAPHVIQNNVTSRGPGVVNSVDIIKTAIMFIKTTFKKSIKVKRSKNYVLKCNFYLYFL